MKVQDQFYIRFFRGSPGDVTKEHVTKPLFPFRKGGVPTVENDVHAFLVFMGRGEKNTLAPRLRLKNGKKGVVRKMYADLW